MNGEDKSREHLEGLYQIVLRKWGENLAAYTLMRESALNFKQAALDFKAERNQAMLDLVRERALRDQCQARTQELWTLANELLEELDCEYGALAAKPNDDGVAPGLTREQSSQVYAWRKILGEEP